MDLGFAPLFLSGFRRAVLRVDRAQSTAGKRLRGYHRLRTCLPLRRIRHAARASDRSCFMTFETDSQTRTRESARESPSESKCQIWFTSLYDQVLMPHFATTPGAPRLLLPRPLPWTTE